MSPRTAVFTSLAMAVLPGVPIGSSDAASKGVEEPLAGGVPADFITKLKIDWLDDDVELPQAYAVNSGVLPATGETRFRVLALTYDPRCAYDVTADLQRIRIPDQPGGNYRPRGRLSIHTHGLGKGRGALPEFRYDVEQKAISYRPRWNTRLDRGVTGSLSFRWQLRSPRVTYTTTFVLAIPPRMGS